MQASAAAHSEKFLPTTMTTSGGNQPNLAECEASDLAMHLLEHRFSVS